MFVSQKAQAQGIQVIYTVSNFHGGNNVSCHGSSDGWINVVVVGGMAPYYFNWSNNSYSQNLSNVVAGNYTVTITDMQGSTASVTITMREPNALSIHLVPIEYEGGYNISENGGHNGFIETEISGGVQDYSYSWSNNATDSKIEGLTAGLYSLTVNDMNGCASSSSVTLIEPTELHVVSIASPLNHGYNISCNDKHDGVINLSVTGGYQGGSGYHYKWNNGSTEQNPERLSAGHYSVIITDDNNAAITAQIDLTQPPKFEITNITPLIYPNGNHLSCHTCANGKLTVNVTGGVSPLTYHWELGQTTQTISNLSANTYYVTVTDANGCTSIGNRQITAPDQEDWSMTGNLNTNPATQFMGTSDNKDFVFRTNNTERLRLTGTGTILVPGLIQAGVTDTKMLFIGPNGGLLSGLAVDISSLQAHVSACNNYVTAFPWLSTNIMGPYGFKDLTNCYQRFGFGTITPKERAHLVGFARFSDPDLAGTPNNYLNIGFNAKAKINSYGTDLFINDDSPRNVKINIGTVQGDVMTGGNTYLATISGRVGIGVTNPTEKLEVDGNIRATGLIGSGNRIILVDASGRLASSSANNQLPTWMTAGNAQTNSTTDFLGTTDLQDLVFRTNSIQRFRMLKGENSCIFYEPEPISSITLGAIPYSGSNRYISNYIGFNARRVQNGSTYEWQSQTNGNDNGGCGMIADIGGNLRFFALPTMSAANAPIQSFATDEIFITSNTKMIIRADGKVGIGVSAFCQFPDDYNLYVTKGIRAEKIKVDVPAAHGWADYVFSKDYKLTSISEIDSFIKREQHLPGVPTSAEVNEKGIDIGEMQTILLEKIEQLTLYVIELDSKNKELERKCNKLLRNVPKIIDSKSN